MLNFDLVPGSRQAAVRTTGLGRGSNFKHKISLITPYQRVISLTSTLRAKFSAARTPPSHRCLSLVLPPSLPRPMTLLLRRSSAASSVAVAVAPASYSNPSVATLLSSCRTLRGLEQIHARIIRKGLEQHHLLATLFISLCDTLATPAYATATFGRLARPNLILWNALLAAHARRSPLSATLSVFNRLRRFSPLPPDAFTFPSLLHSCSREPASLPVGASVHAAVIRCGLEVDIFVCTALIDFYGKCREIEAARRVFDSMEHRNVVSWTAMVVGYLNSVDLDSARALFNEMLKRNVVTWNAMIDGYVGSGDLLRHPR